jgi:hypothetical protein
MCEKKSLPIDFHLTLYYGTKIRHILYINLVKSSQDCILTYSSAVLCVRFYARQQLSFMCCLNLMGMEKIREQI